MGFIRNLSLFTAANRARIDKGIVMISVGPFFKHGVWYLFMNKLLSYCMAVKWTVIEPTTYSMHV